MSTSWSDRSVSPSSRSDNRVTRTSRSGSGSYHRISRSSSFNKLPEQSKTPIQRTSSFNSFNKLTNWLAEEAPPLSPELQRRMSFEPPPPPLSPNLQSRCLLSPASPGPGSPASKSNNNSPSGFLFVVQDYSTLQESVRLSVIGQPKRNFSHMACISDGTLVFLLW